MVWRNLTTGRRIATLSSCAAMPRLQEPVEDPAKFPWHESSKVQHYWLEVDAMTKPMQERAIYQ